jgi:hypothetical protein
MELSWRVQSGRKLSTEPSERIQFYKTLSTEPSTGYNQTRMRAESSQQRFNQAGCIAWSCRAGYHQAGSSAQSRQERCNQTGRSAHVNDTIRLQSTQPSERNQSGTTFSTENAGMIQSGWTHAARKKSIRHDAEHETHDRNDTIRLDAQHSTQPSIANMPQSTKTSCTTLARNLDEMLGAAGACALQPSHPENCVEREVRYARRPLTQPKEVSFDSGSGHCDTHTKHTAQNKTHIIEDLLDGNSGSSSLNERQCNWGRMKAHRLWHGELRTNTPSRDGITEGVDPSHIHTLSRRRTERRSHVLMGKVKLFDFKSKLGWFGSDRS